jgi:hypothetical protein
LNRRLFTDATQTKVLEDGDPAASFLIGGRGTAIYDDQAKKYGLDESHRLKEGEEVEDEVADDATDESADEGAEEVETEDSADESPKTKRGRGAAKKAPARKK